MPIPMHVPSKSSRTIATLRTYAYAYAYGYAAPKICVCRRRWYHLLIHHVVDFETTMRSLANKLNAISIGRKMNGGQGMTRVHQGS